VLNGGTDLNYGEISAAVLLARKPF